MEILQFIMDLIFQPGSSLKLVPAINVTLLILISVLFLQIFYTDVARIHFFVLASLSLGLLLSVNYVYMEVSKIKKNNEENDSTVVDKKND